MFDFSGGISLGDWGINFGVGAGNTSATPTGGTTVPTPSVTRTDSTNQQILMLGLIVLAFIVLRKG